jgi:DNA-directed RNA polymerase beta subunit
MLMFARSVSFPVLTFWMGLFELTCCIGGQMGYSGYCKLCESEKAVRRITMPYAAKLLIQELGSMNVKVTIGLEDEFPRNLD